MVRSLANVIFKKIWARLVLLRQQLLKTEGNAKLQKESNQDRKMSELAVSATEQIQKQVDKSLEPKLDMLLARKGKTNVLKTKPIKKDQCNKLKSNPTNTKEQFAKKEPQMRDHFVDSGSTLAKFAKQNFGVELSNDASSDSDDIKPSGKGKFYDCYGIDVAPMNIFENQVIPSSNP